MLNAPACTADTTSALRRATHRMVLRGGRSVGSISPPSMTAIGPECLCVKVFIGAAPWLAAPSRHSLGIGPLTAGQNIPSLFMQPGQALFFGLRFSLGLFLGIDHRGTAGGRRFAFAAG